MTFWSDYQSHCWEKVEDNGPETALPIIDLDSSGPLPDLAEPLPSEPSPGECPDSNVAGRAKPEAVSDGGASSAFWLDGNVLMCACPDCGAPMTVRLWLMVADCWRCETSIELTEEQEREVRRMLSGAAEGPAASSGQRSPAGPTAGRWDDDTTAAATGATSRSPAPAVSRPGPRVAHEPSAPPRARGPKAVEHLQRRRRASRQVSIRVNDFLKNMPAWLFSLLFHVVLLIILGLLTNEQKRGEYITLSTRVSRLVREGGDTRIVDPTDKSVYDLGVPDSIDLSDPAMQRAMVRAHQDARELRLTNPSSPYLTDFSKVKEEIHASTRDTLAVRDPRMRIDMVKREGGTTLTEAAVARGLRWLSRHQGEDGSWSLDRFHHAGECRCDGRGGLSSDSAGTALALLPFLGAGQTHLTGIYQDEVARGLRWLIQHQAPNGDLRGTSKQYPGMYAQGQAAIVLCEAFLMTGDEQLREPARKAIKFIVDAQYPGGGWRYYPRREGRPMRGDTSVLGWQLMALQSALAAKLSVPEATLENAGHFLDQVQHRDGALYSYMPGEEPTAPMTAEALLCRIYLGWKRNHPALRSGVTWLSEHEPPRVDAPNIYYWYYAAQTMHHFGGPQWHEWNLQLRDVLVSMQETRGHAAGSWAPVGPLTSRGGRVYMTALAICCLEVYYRHLPIFRQIDLE
ncbi:MAG: prenyltransferase/squalene oxidase repeat-containing protein [Planctomycetota bacterium]